MNSYFHDIYFTKHAFNTEREVELVNVDSMKKEDYEQRLKEEMRGATVLNLMEKMSPCNSNLYSSIKTTSGLLFITMENGKDFTTWLALAKCLGVWDLDARGFHRGMVRLTLSGRKVFIVVVPFSPYS